MRVSVVFVPVRAAPRQLFTQAFQILRPVTKLIGVIIIMHCFFVTLFWTLDKFVHFSLSPYSVMASY